MFEVIDFVDLSISNLEEVLNWRNDDKIRCWMHNKEKISLEQHLNFVKSLKISKEKKYYLIKEKENRIGVFYLTGINQQKTFLGIYLNPEVLGKGYGNRVLEYMTIFSREKLGIKSLFLEVYNNNCSAIKIYKKNNFNIIDEKEGVLTLKKEL